MIVQLAGEADVTVDEDALEYKDSDSDLDYKVDKQKG